MRVLGLLLLGCFLVSQAKSDPQLGAGRVRGYNNIPVPGGYLPPPPDNPMCVPVTTTRRIVSSTQRVVTVTPSVPDSTTIQVITDYRPTTVYSNILSTYFDTTYIGQTQTDRRDVTSTRVTTIGGIPVTRTVSTAVTSVRRDTRTEYDTVQSVIYVTSTRVDRDETTLVVPTTIYRTIVSTAVNTVPFYERDITRTSQVRTTIYSTIQTQLPAETVYNTQTRYSTVYETELITLPAQTITRFQTSTVYNTITSRTTLREFVTSTRQTTSFVQDLVTNTNTRYVTVTSTYGDTRTSQVINYNTKYDTEVIYSTVYDSEIIYTTIRQPDVFRTNTEQSTVTITGEGGVRYTTLIDYSTSYQDRTTTSFVGGQDRTITATSTVQATCGPTGYNYPEPDIAFTF